MAKKPLVYLDYAAATPIDSSVLEAMTPYFSDYFFNPSATYTAGKEAKKQLESARARVSYWLGAKQSEVQFTAGGTEANNIAIHGVMSRYPKANMVMSAIEHDAVRGPASKHVVRVAGVLADGRVDIEALVGCIDHNTVLVSVMYANHEVGTVQPIREIGRQIQSERKKRAIEGNRLPLFFHSDACQAANYLDLHVARLGVDMLTLNGGKMYGPKQSGVLYVRAGIELIPLLQGGGQEHGLRPGTENVAAAVGFAAALDLAQAQRTKEVRRIQILQKQFVAGLNSISPSIIINGSKSQRLPNNIHVTIPETDNERVLVQLDEAGILAAAGSACTASSQEPSHVLKAMGVSDADARASLRFSLGRHTTASEIDATIAVLQRLITVQ